MEDEEALLALGKRMLEQLGYCTVAAHGPDRALKLAAEHVGPIDLVLTDVVMPSMSGRDLWERLTVMRPNTKCLFMSGYTADVISHQGVLDEGVHFVAKPFSLEALGRAIRQALED